MSVGLSVIASITLSNFVLVKSLIELCFSCFRASDWLGIREGAVAKGNSIVMLDKATPIVKVQLLVNTGIERLPVTMAVVIYCQQYLEQQLKDSSF